MNTAALNRPMPPQPISPRTGVLAAESAGSSARDERAPTFWVLADAQGNKACVTTWQGRSH